MYIKSANGGSQRPSLYEVNKAWAAQRAKSMQKSQQLTASLSNSLSSINNQVNRLPTQARNAIYSTQLVNKFV